MKYLSLDTLDVSTHVKPDALKAVHINIRGTKNLFNIFFSAIDVEMSFNILLSSNIDFTWINTPSGKEKYLSYKTLKSVLFPIKDQMFIIDLFLIWVDSLLFINTKPNSFFCEFTGIAPVSSSTESTVDSFDDIDDIHDSEYVNNDSDVYDFTDIDDSDIIDDKDLENEHLIRVLQTRVDQLEHELEIKTKDIHILHRDIQIRDKEIELLDLKCNSRRYQSTWI